MAAQAGPSVNASSPSWHQQQHKLLVMKNAKTLWSIRATHTAQQSAHHELAQLCQCSHIAHMLHVTGSKAYCSPVHCLVYICALCN
jgi:hypothetical protein